MKKRYYISLLCAALLTASADAQDLKLPKVNILGKEYYYYEVKKGDSIYGIAKKFGWDPAELLHLNPHTASSMQKGSRLYYPTEYKKVAEASSNDIEQYGYEPITHLVKKGETAYSIAHQYDISLETLYANCPSARYGVKAGEIIEIRQPSADSTDGERYLYYNVRSDDTLPQIVKTYGTSVEDLLAANPGLTEKQLKEGSVIRIPINSNRERVRTEIVSEEQLESLDNYKIKKNDTWDKISDATGVSVDELKAANTDTRRLKKDQIIAVPQMKEVEVEREVVEEDPRELTFEGRQEIYDSIHHVEPLITDGSVNVAVLLDAPTAKRDIEFMRGVLLALDKMKHSSYKVALKVIDGREKQASVERQLEEFKPHVVFATADKNFPDFLAEYGDRNKVEIINVFNVKSDLYQTNPSMIQLQPPSLFFNDEVIGYVGDRYSDRRLIMVGEKDHQDAVAEGIEKLYAPSQAESISLDALKEYNFSNNEDYIIYCHATKRDDVLEAVAAVEHATREHPSSRITLLGRPSWVTLADVIGNKISLSDVRIPSRFYYDPDSSEAEEFTSVFNQMYGTSPAKSFPMYSVTGYDVARTFIPGVVYNSGDLNKGLPATITMQAEIEPVRVNNWGGFYNQVCYLLRFTPSGKIDRERLK